MKKFLSIMLALLMVISVLGLAGCKKGGDAEHEPKTKAELLEYGFEQLMAPEIFGSITDGMQIKDANHYELILDKLAIGAPGMIGNGEAEQIVMPVIEIIAETVGEKGLVLELAATLDDETLKFGAELTEDEKLFIDIPDASEKYISITTEQMMALLFGLGEGDVAMSSMAVAEIIAEMSASLGGYVFDDKYISEETADAEVFGETRSLKKITWRMDRDVFFEIVEKVVKDLMEKLPEEITGGEAPDFDELREEMQDVDLNFGLDFYFDGETLSKLGIDMKIEADEEKIEVNGALDMINTAKEFKQKGDIKIVMLGEEIAKIKVDTEIGLENDELEGEMKLTPEFDFEALEAPVEAAQILEDFEIVCNIEGTLTDEAFDIETEYELSIGGMAIKLPLAFKGEIKDDKFTADIDIDFNLMGVSLEMGAEYVVEKKDDVKPIERDPAKAVSPDDEEAFEALGEDVMTYLEGLEGFAELFGSMGGTSEYPDEENPILFNIYNDDIDAYFFADGTGYQSVRYDLVSDSANGKYTVVDGAGNTVLVINLTGVETAEIDGFDFTYEMYDFGDGEVDYYFYSDEVATEVTLYPYIDEAWIDNPLAYTMSDSLLTVNGGAMEYTLDEDEGIIILDGEEYSFVSYDEY